MKKVIVVLLVLVALFGFSACNSDEAADGVFDDDDSGEVAALDEVSNNPYLVLVNKDNELPDNWEDKVQIDSVENSLGEGMKIEHETYEQFTKLRDALLEQGVQIELDSVYRSVDEQQEIWDEWSSDPDFGKEYCKKYLAVPGYSEHHTGLAVDIFIMKNGEEIRDNDDMITDKEDFALVHKLMPEYGFILRYPPERDIITGYAYEPWHMRYVGDAKVAKEIMDKDITFEEYLAELKEELTDDAE